MRISATRCLCFLVLSSLSTDSASADPLAFPTATGQGATAVGGRGGDVYHVTTLDDYNSFRKATKIPGSLRHAIRSATGPRTIVFDVSGVIHLKAPMEILKSRLTVAGQTSPGGITLCGYPLEISQASDVIVRFLRVRLGDFRARASGQSDSSDCAKFQPGSSNAINVGPDCQRIILDHVSASWSIDETLSVTNSRDVTIQHCIIAESLNRSFHPKGPHGYGSLVRGSLTADDQRDAVGGYTFLGNLWAHHRARNPSVGGQQRIPAGRPESSRLRTDVNLVNNVVFDWGDMPSHRSQKGQVRINLVGNYYICGPSKSGEYIFRESETDSTAVFHEGNYFDADQDSEHNGITVTASSTEAFREFDAQDKLLAPPHGRPFPFFACVQEAIVSADASYQRVIESAGASLWRDAVDQRIIASLQARDGGLIDSQESLRDTSGRLAGIDDMPVQVREAGFDTDQDGMPDSYEISHGLNPLVPSDGAANTLSEDAFSNLECYLNSIAP